MRRVIMGVTIVEGDLLQAPENIIGHQVNCMGVMGSGVAKQIRNQYPEAYKQYRLASKGIERFLLGTCQLVKISDGKYIANLFGQNKYGKVGVFTEYTALRFSLENLAEISKRRNLSVALPYKIGCDRGGGDWTVVFNMIEDIFEDTDVVLYKLGGN
jgi:O-acetyl-ADP-ribose deacetylase (regulator of RNase III)